MSDLDVEEIDQTGHDEVTSLEKGKLLDYITGLPVKDTPKEQVRQCIARALFHEYGISVEDMVPDFKMKVDGRTQSIDIAIFEPGAEATPENLRGGFRNTGRFQGSVAPEVLFIARCLDWLKPGGRLGIVLPDGIRGNPGDVNGHSVVRVLRRKEKTVDDDLPRIAEAYRELHKSNPAHEERSTHRH